MIGVMLIHNVDVIKKTLIILDNCSIDRVTKQLDYVKDVKNCTKYEEVTLLTNVGSLLFDRKGRLKFLPLCGHVNNNDLVTILSLKDMKSISGVRGTMDTSIEKAINLILSDGKFSI